MPTHTFETRGPVDPKRNYIVPRTNEITDLAHRINDGRYVVIFAPRQTGKRQIRTCILWKWMYLVTHL